VSSRVQTPPALPVPAPPGRLRRLLAPLWVRAALVYLVLRAVSGVLLALAAREQVWFPGVTGPREGHVDLAVSWDAMWYERIATDGYPDVLPVGPDGRVQQNPWAFYPLFPAVVRAISGLTGAGFATVAPLVALVAGLGAAVVIAHLLRAALPSGPSGPAGPAATGPVLAAVAVWAALPAAPVLQMAYTESLSVLLLAGALLLLLRERWWGAAACALLLGVTRPIALPLMLVVLAAVWLRWRRRDLDPLTGRERVGVLAAVLATGISGVAWTAIAWWGTGRRDAYPQTMTAWRGEAVLAPLEPWWRTIEGALTYRTAGFVVPAISIVVALALALAFLLPVVGGPVDLRLRVWCAAYSVYLLAVVDGTTSIVRYLVPLFPLALLLVGAHRSPASRWWPWRTGFWLAAGIVGQVGWIWWLVLFTPPADLPP